MNRKPAQKGYKKGGSVSAQKKGAPARGNAKKAAPAFGKRPRGKIPALGSGMIGLGGTGAQGMLP